MAAVYTQICGRGKSEKEEQQQEEEGVGQGAKHRGEEPSRLISTPPQSRPHLGVGGISASWCRPASDCPSDFDCPCHPCSWAPGDWVA